MTELSNKISFYPENIRYDCVLLVSDSDLSRLTFIAVYIFSKFEVDLLILSEHNSLFIKPFDLCTASELKSNFKSQINKTVKYLFEIDLSKREKSAFIIYESVESFLNELSTGCNK
jgi:hypothetical protein